ncbi:helix-turn-helix domain-containing protein [Cellulomonas soli]|uniref:helix-turn-helix domain-containing protein n=1 Tax=Cellulomonas soli TaxID=931535 RepID=UPI003F8699D0
MATTTPDPVDASVGAWVRRFREGRGLTQRQLAERLADSGWEIATTGITKIEKGSRSLRVSEVARIAAALGVEPADLMHVRTSDFKSQMQRSVTNALDARRALRAMAANVTSMNAFLQRPGARELAAGHGLSGTDLTDIIDLIAQLVVEADQDDPLQVWGPSVADVRRAADGCRDLISRVVEGLVSTSAFERDHDGEHPEAP